MKEYSVAIEKDTSAISAVRKAIQLIGGMDSFIDRGQTVMIKPNCLINAYTPGTVTSKEVVRILLNCYAIASHFSPFQSPDVYAA